MRKSSYEEIENSENSEDSVGFSGGQRNSLRRSIVLKKDNEVVAFITYYIISQLENNQKTICGRCKCNTDQDRPKIYKIREKIDIIYIEAIATLTKNQKNGYASKLINKVKNFNVPILLKSAFFDSECNNAPKFYVNRHKFKAINFERDIKNNRNNDLFPHSKQGDLMYKFFFYDKQCTMAMQPSFGQYYVYYP